MQLQQPKEQLLIRYLLGELSRQEEGELEERFCSDNLLFEMMLARREELIEAYLSDQLDPKDRRQFEQQIMSSPSLRKSVENSKAFRQALVSEQIADRPVLASVGTGRVSWRQSLRDLLRAPKLAPGLAMLVMLVFFLGSLAVFYSWRLRKELTQVEGSREMLQQNLAQERQRADALDAELKLAQKALEKPSPPSGQVPRPDRNLMASAVLASDYDVAGRGLAGNKRGTLVLRSNVQLRLKLRDYDYPGYRVTIRELSSNRLVWQQDGLKAQTDKNGKVLILTLPASRFVGTAKDYFVSVDGHTVEGKYEEGVDRYSFQVEATGHR